MEKILVELGKALIPDILYPAKHTGLSFVCFMGAIALYWHLMLNDDDVGLEKGVTVYSCLGGCIRPGIRARHRRIHQDRGRRNILKIFYIWNATPIHRICSDQHFGMVGT